MSKCAGCGGAYRKGSNVLLVGMDGRVASRIVCPRCEKRAVRLVAAAVPPQVLASDEAAELKADWKLKEAWVLRQLAIYAKAARVTEKTSDTEHARAHASGRAEGYEGAVELIRGHLKLG